MYFYFGHVREKTQESIKKLKDREIERTDVRHIVIV